MYQYPSRVWGSSTSSGTGAITITGFSADLTPWSTWFGIATVVYYVIKGATYSEEGIGTFDPGTQQLTRDLIRKSTNANALVVLPSATTHNVFVVYPGEPWFFDSFSGTKTLSIAEHGNIQQFTGAASQALNLPGIATVPPGFKVPVFNDGTAALTLDPNGAETIEGAATLVLMPGEAGFLAKDATQWRLKRCMRVASATIASAATVDLAKAAGSLVHVSGSTGPITSFGSPPPGAEFMVVFDAAPQVNNTANIVIPGGAPYQTGAGCVGRVISDGGGVCRFIVLAHAGGVANMGKVTIASAATVDLTTVNASLVHISGNGGPITSFGSPPPGAEFEIVLDSNPQINTTANILVPGGANIIGAADVSLRLSSEGSGVVRVTKIQSGSGAGWAWNGGAVLAAGNNAWNHSLGVSPRKAMVRAAIVCTSTDAGYAVGDSIPLFTTQPDNANRMTTLANDADGNTSRVVINGGINVAHKATQANTILTLASWTLYIGVQLEF
ncbi:MAG TPA: hypothetical protein VGF92_03880 [Stellaceae bacterium]|jgi:hypothetical protein